jgi:gluconate 2-dehydrogenase gamma chain
MSDQPTRRDTLKALAIVGALQHHPPPPAADAAPYKPAFFTAPEYACVEAIVARIIPSDGTPGAKEAGVAAYIDETVQRDSRLHEVYRQGLGSLIAAGFASLPAADQDAKLAELGEAGGAFWKSIRRLTIDGYYTSKIGLTELGYSGKSFLSEFKGCTHPEHQT